MSIRTVLVDDEPLATQGLQLRLQAFDDVEIVGTAANGREAIRQIKTHKPDLVFLDIQMPEVGGFDVVEAIGVARMPAVVFVTAYDEHALRAFDVHAVDYVLKPIDRHRFRTAVERARRRLADAPGQLDSQLNRRVAAALGELGRPSHDYAKRIAIKGDGRVILVDVDEVDRLEAAGNYVEVHNGARHHLLRETMASLEGRLDPARFVRGSRSSRTRATPRTRTSSRCASRSAK